MVNKEEYEEQLKKAIDYHGELCGGIAIGTKLAMYGMELMGFELNKRHKNLVVFLEIDRCMADAILVVTNCSMGKRALKQMNYGKFAVTFCNMDTGEAIRICDDDANNQKSNKKETREELVQRFRDTPAEELFKAQKVRIVGVPDAQWPGAKHTSTFCSICGEKVTDDHHILRGGKPVCISCAKGSYYELIDDE